MFTVLSMHWTGNVVMDFITGFEIVLSLWVVCVFLGAFDYVSYLLCFVGALLKIKRKIKMSCNS